VFEFGATLEFSPHHSWVNIESLPPPLTTDRKKLASKDQTGIKQVSNQKNIENLINELFDAYRVLAEPAKQVGQAGTFDEDEMVWHDRDMEQPKYEPKPVFEFESKVRELKNEWKAEFGESLPHALWRKPSEFRKRFKSKNDNRYNFYLRDKHQLDLNDIREDLLARIPTGGQPQLRFDDDKRQVQRLDNNKVVKFGNSGKPFEFGKFIYEQQPTSTSLENRYKSKSLVSTNKSSCNQKLKNIGLKIVKDGNIYRFDNV